MLRNEPCPCGSGLKFRHCHGDHFKLLVVDKVAKEKMAELIEAEQKIKGVKNE